MKATKRYSDPKPEWMLRRERLAAQSFDDAIVADSEFKWRKSAEAAVKRIMANHYCPTMPNLKRLRHTPVRRIRL